MLLDDQAAWAAVNVAIVAVLASLIGAGYQVHKQRLLSSASLVSQLLAEFDQPEFAPCRRRCAHLAIHHLKGDSVTLVGNNGFGVLGKFEHIAYLVRLGALDRKMVHNKFAWEMVGFYTCFTAGSNLIEALRINYVHSGVYEHYQWLVAQLIRDYQSKGVAVFDAGGRLTWLDPFLERESTVGALEPAHSCVFCIEG